MRPIYITLMGPIWAAHVVPICLPRWGPYRAHVGMLAGELIRVGWTCTRLNKTFFHLMFKFILIV